jgi:hypothetical protein
MKDKLVLLTILLALAVLSAACAAQQSTEAPGEVTEAPTVSTDNSTATEDAGATVPTPTGAQEGSTSVPGTEETGTTPTASADSATPAEDASGAAGIPQTGPGDAGVPDDLDEVMRVLRTAGVTVDLGDPIEAADFSTVPGQILFIDGEEVEIYTYTSAEELEADASRLARQDDPEGEPDFYKLGNMLVRYIGENTLVRDLLEDVLGAQAAGQ